MKHTALFQTQVDAGGKMVDFNGWEMAINFGSQIDEHHQVRQDCGMFDVSHMSVIEVKGVDGTRFLRHILSADVAKTTIGKAIYSCMLNVEGGVLDDLIVYHRGDKGYRLVVNAATADSDLTWIMAQAEGFKIEVEVLKEVAIIAVQGPNARSKVFAAMPGVEEVCGDLQKFSSASIGSLFIARTGYTGEDGFEIILPAKSAVFTWKMLGDVGVKPCGLAARDTLRLEAGLSLYGAEMDEMTTPFDANLSWCVDFNDESRDFIGRAAYANLKSEKTIVGLVLEGKGMIRKGQIVECENGDGVVTSGGFSPTMKVSIGLARVPKNSVGKVKIQIRNKTVFAKIVAPPFVKNGEILVKN